MRPSRVLFFEANSDGTVGGSHQALFDLVTGLDREEFEPVVVFLQEDRFSQKLIERGVEFHNLGDMYRSEVELRRSSARPRRILDMLGGIERRARFLHQQNIDLVHLNNTPHYGGDDWLPAAQLNRIPIVSSVMGKGSAQPSSWIWRQIYTRFARILPVSQIIQDRWELMGVPHERMTKIHHGVDIERIHARRSRDAEDVRHELEVPDGALLVVMAGNIRRWKGQHVVLKALAHLDPAVRDQIRVRFAGAVSTTDSSYADELEGLLDAHDLREVVDFLGFRRDLPDILGAADIVVHASIEIEPGGIVVMEAMTFGTAVVASKLGGHAEVLIPGTGLTFDPEAPEELARCITELVEDGALRRSLGAAARARIENYSVRRNVEETQAVYREVLGSTNGR